jgi:hypothetical protein
MRGIASPHASHARGGGVASSVAALGGGARALRVGGGCEGRDGFVAAPASSGEGGAGAVGNVGASSSGGRLSHSVAAAAYASASVGAGGGASVS